MFSDMKTLQNQTVVVLGGTSGIGLAVAKQAAEEGARVIVGSRRSDPAVDLTDEAAIRGFFEAIGPMDHLVFTAGESLVLGPLASLEPNAIRKAFDLRVFGAFLAVKYAKIRKNGSIVLTHGIAGERPLAGWTVGASICGAMESLTRALAVELAPIRVNAVSPGFVRTPLWGDPTAIEPVFREAAAKLPLGRVGDPTDLAESYVYLMKNAFTTGRTVIADGGALLV